MPDERIAVSDLKSELGDLIKNTQDILTASSDEGMVVLLYNTFIKEVGCLYV